jgi:hypothetical protein
VTVRHQLTGRTIRLSGPRETTLISKIARPTTAVHRLVHVSRSLPSFERQPTWEATLILASDRPVSNGPGSTFPKKVVAMSKDLRPLAPIAIRFPHDLKINGKGERTQQSYVRMLREFSRVLELSGTSAVPQGGLNSS